jgi:hypothetical protein
LDLPLQSFVDEYIVNPQNMVYITILALMIIAFDAYRRCVHNSLLAPFFSLVERIRAHTPSLAHRGSALERILLVAALHMAASMLVRPALVFLV